MGEDNRKINKDATLYPFLIVLKNEGLEYNLHLVISSGLFKNQRFYDLAGNKVGDENSIKGYSDSEKPKRFKIGCSVPM